MKKIILVTLLFPIFSCVNENKIEKNIIKDSNLEYKKYISNGEEIIISRSNYFNKLKGFWLAQCIANWTGLITEMDKTGNIGKVKTGPFYTREDWGKEDQRAYWERKAQIRTIDFVFEDDDGLWGADDDTDIEYIYQHLLYTNKTSKLTGEQIRDGWLKHIKNKEEKCIYNNG